MPQIFQANLRERIEKVTNMPFFRRLELEWKILLLAAVLFIAFAWPVQRYFIARLSETMEQSIDPRLEKTLRKELSASDGIRRGILKEHLERYRQTRVLIPIIVAEQQRLLLSLSLGLFIFFLLLALWVLKRLTRPLKHLALAVEIIGRGGIAQIGHTSGGALGKVELAVINLQEELLALREKAHLQGMEAAWKDIARIMAHEIKNPLTPIRLTLDRIQERMENGQPVSNEELLKFTARINQQVDMLERLVDQFRSFSREQEVNLSEVELSTFVRSVTEDMARKIRTVVTGDAMLRSDPYLLHQIFLNLWKNSLEAGADLVTVDIITQGAEVVVAIRDNGSGIDPADLDRVWLPYFTLKKNGSGLGLPVVKKLVETLHGSISLTSTRNDGVKVTLYFPSTTVPESA